MRVSSPSTRGTTAPEIAATARAEATASAEATTPATETPTAAPMPPAASTAPAARLHRHVLNEQRGDHAQQPGTDRNPQHCSERERETTRAHAGEQRAQLVAKDAAYVVKTLLDAMSDALANGQRIDNRDALRNFSKRSAGIAFPDTGKRMFPDSRFSASQSS